MNDNDANKTEPFLKISGTLLISLITLHFYVLGFVYVESISMDKYYGLLDSSVENILRATGIIISHLIFYVWDHCGVWCFVACMVAIFLSLLFIDFIFRKRPEYRFPMLTLFIIVVMFNPLYVLMVAKYASEIDRKHNYRHFVGNVFVPHTYMDEYNTLINVSTFVPVDGIRLMCKKSDGLLRIAYPYMFDAKAIKIENENVTLVYEASIFHVRQNRKTPEKIEYIDSRKNNIEDFKPRCYMDNQQVYYLPDNIKHKHHIKKLIIERSKVLSISKNVYKY